MHCYINKAISGKFTNTANTQHNSMQIHTESLHALSRRITFQTALKVMQVKPRYNPSSTHAYLWRCSITLYAKPIQRSWPRRRLHTCCVDCLKLNKLVSCRQAVEVQLWALRIEPQWLGCCINVEVCHIRTRILYHNITTCTSPLCLSMVLFPRINFSLSDRVCYQIVICVYFLGFINYFALS